MSDHRDQDAPRSSEPDATGTSKLPWQPPSLEEVDYSATEASGMLFVISDFPSYGS